MDTALFYTCESSARRSDAFPDPFFFSVGDPEEEFLGGHYYSQELLKESGGGEWLSLSVSVWLLMGSQNFIDEKYVQYSDLRHMLYDSASEAGAEILLGTEVVSIDPSTHSVTDSRGTVYTADVIIAADGALGLGRKVLGGQDGTPSVYNFYTLVVPSIVSLFFFWLRTIPGQFYLQRTFPRFHS